MARLLLSLVVVAGLGACAKSGSNGNAYVVIDGWTPDIVGVDLTGIGAQAGGKYYFSHTKYKLKTGTGFATWQSTSAIYGANMSITVNDGSKPTAVGPIAYENGADGADKVYHLYFTSDVMYVSSAGAPSVPTVQLAPRSAQIAAADGVMGLIEAGHLKLIE